MRKPVYVHENKKGANQCPYSHSLTSTFVVPAFISEIARFELASNSIAVSLQVWVLPGQKCKARFSHDKAHM